MQFLPDNSGTGNQLPVASQSGLLGVPSAESGPSDQPETRTQKKLEEKKAKLAQTRNLTGEKPYGVSKEKGPPLVGSLQPPAKRRRHANANSENTNARQLGAVGASGADYRTVGSLSQANIAKGKKRNHRGPQRPSDTTAKSNSAMDLPPPGFAPPGFNTIGEAYFSAKPLMKRKKQEPIQNFANLAESDSKETTCTRHSSKYLSAKGELKFFQHLKTYFEDQKTYNELLKIINLFTQDLIDLETLVYRVKPFLINCPELFTQFTEIVGWREGAMMPQMNGSVNSHLSKRKKFERLPESGPSYQKLPESDALSACSRRDAQCWEVLNDKWVCGPPSLTVEEQVFLPCQTNAFERALYQAEDERHENNYHIKANVRMIALLKPINLRIQQMDPITGAKYRLKPGLGVIQALHDNPAVAVPIVLARLKQKDEEWKKALWDWNRVWREVNGKNYLKVQDHQGISFKTIDKKIISNKNLVNEIDLIKQEQQQRGKIAMNPLIILFLPKYQLEFDFKCFDVFYDILKVFIHFLDHIPQSTGLDDHHKDRDRTQWECI
ncbi:Sin3 family co-repressor-domain-containing protein [Phakopsora pachyrhizi]|nr:Sin3 family co-repressor-domain-containing protein [Phakopsora pachyrhizi]